MIIFLFCRPLFCHAVDQEPSWTIAPFVEYQYHVDKGEAEDILDGVNDVIGGWLRGYKDIELFEHLWLVGAEVRLTRPKMPEGLLFFSSLAGTAGSTGMLKNDYDRRYSLNTFPIIPGIVDTDTLPFFDLYGDVRIRVDQYLDYYFPLQIGVRYEPNPEKSWSVFGSLSGGVLFYKGGMDIDVDMSGTADFLTVSGRTTARYRGKVEVEDIGWIMSAMAGMRFYWRRNLTSSLAVGFETGRLKDNADVDGTFSGNVRIDSAMYEIDTPFSTGFDDRQSIDIRTDGWRLRLVIVEWKW